MLQKMIYTESGDYRPPKGWRIQAISAYPGAHYSTENGGRYHRQGTMVLLKHHWWYGKLIPEVSVK